MRDLSNIIRHLPIISRTLASRPKPDFQNNLVILGTAVFPANPKEKKKVSDSAGCLTPLFQRRYPNLGPETGVEELLDI